MYLEILDSYVPILTLSALWIANVMSYVVVYVSNLASWWIVHRGET